MALNGVQGLRPWETVGPTDIFGNQLLNRMQGSPQEEDSLGRSAGFRAQRLRAPYPPQRHYRPAAMQQPTELSPHGAVDALVKTCQRWHLSTSDQITLLGYGGSESLGLQFLEGRLSAPPQDARDRGGYVLGISLGLGALFNDSEEAELLWLREPRPALGGRSAIEFMLEGRMSNLMVVAQMVAAERGL
jgi:Protein of unknown function (DUF2384)